MAVITYLDAISQALREEMRRDPAVFLMGEDIGVFGGAFKITRGFIEEFGEERVIDTPISESGFTGAACGAAIMGFRPVVEFQAVYHALADVAVTIEAHRLLSHRAAETSE